MKKILIAILLAVSFFAFCLSWPTPSEPFQAFQQLLILGSMMFVWGAVVAVVVVWEVGGRYTPPAPTPAKRRRRAVEPL